MPEHFTPAIYYVAIHLLYASAVAGVAWILSTVGTASASAKYWIWVGTLVNFIVPTGAVVDRVLAHHLAWARPLESIGGAVEEFSRSPFALGVLVAWALGTALMLALLGLRLRAERRGASGAGDVRSARLVADGVPVLFSRNFRIPAVDGILRPWIALPAGIEGLLTARELDAVLIHEVVHAKRRDNLIRLVYELGRCLLWFHPLMWLVGSRLALYRELSCDEPVIRSARGADLVSALRKFAAPERPGLLQATASSLLRHRLDRLVAPPAAGVSSFLLGMIFCATLVVGVVETAAHTACCFLQASARQER